MSNNLNTQSEMPEPQPKKKRPSVLRLVLTTFAAAFGVQNQENLEEDFSQKSPIPYIIMGVVFTMIFVITVVSVAKYAIS
ncbi:DUF2970 domain-containing protein [Teredinibacter waterburyi]|uniref:DUF2970 domain-containing protein n=1 Tax=Teredinibacter waterburyi TaxID=1500538 RepID=UPI00165F05FD|nr:DUF2970 domain-containing protein [Teredinibacter waterburyi]